MQKFHVKRNDPVIVIAGSQKGKEGKILEILPGKGRARVEGLAMTKHHLKKSEQNPQGSIIEREGSIHLSNLMLKTRHDARLARRGSSAPAGGAAADAGAAPDESSKA
jgi:large subunit ribosomal protein L24